MDVKQFVNEWLEAWNSHDIDRIMSHYSEDIEVTTPMIRLAAGIDSGTLKGKQNVREYWSKALSRLPDLRFELIEITTGVDSFAIYYHSVLGKRAIEVMFYGEDEKIWRMFSMYTE